MKAGDQVRRGAPLVDVDWTAVSAAGYETVTPIVVSNATSFAGVAPKATGPVSRGDLLMIVEPQAAQAAAQV